MEDEAEVSTMREKAKSVENQIDAMSCGDQMEENEEGSEEEELSYDDYVIDIMDDDIMICEKEIVEHEHLKADVKEAARKHRSLQEELAIPSVQIEPSISGLKSTCSVVMTLNVSNLPDMIRHLWELRTAITVSVIVDGVNKRLFRAAFGNLPTVLARIDDDKPSRFPVGECLVNLVNSVIRHMYVLNENLSPAVTGSFFSMLYAHLSERLSTLTEYCMVCGSLLYAGGLLPSICDKELCQYQYQELGLMLGLTTPRVSAPVLSLLLMTFNAAVTSERRESILTPYPTADADKLYKLEVEARHLFRKTDRKSSFAIAKGHEYEVYTNLALPMPCPHDILKTPAHYREFKKEMPGITEFIEWLVISNRSYLELLPTALNVEFLQTPRQFLFVNDTPAKQAEFDALVKAHGGKTRYLFHGSRAENWHSIIRSGLKNMSGTKYMLSGMAYGPGIYLSNYLSTAYCTFFNERNVSEYCVKNRNCCMTIKKGRKYALLAVVEVVDTPEAYQHNKDKIVVVKEEKWCSIRMLVAYNCASHPHIDLEKIRPSDRKQIQDAVHVFKTATLAERIKHAPTIPDIPQSPS